MHYRHIVLRITTLKSENSGIEAQKSSNQHDTTQSYLTLQNNNMLLCTTLQSLKPPPNLYKPTVYLYSVAKPILNNHFDIVLQAPNPPHLQIPHSL
jgi:hypothetical protein